MTVATATRDAPPGTPGARRGGRNTSIEGLRAIGALLVLLTHVSINATGNRGEWGRWLARMDVGVTIFFVISGYLLYKPFARALLQATDRPRLRRYLRHRLLRIVPAYWVVVVASFLFATSSGFGEGAATKPPLGTMLRFATFTQVYWKDSLAGPFPQAWSLAVELGFYLMLPLFAWLLARSAAADRASRLRRQWLGLGALVVVAQVFRLGFVLLDPAYRKGASPAAFTQYGAWLPNHLDVFALGMALAVLSVELADRGPGFGLASRLERALSRPGAAAVSWLAAFACFAIAAHGLGLSTTSIVYGRGQEFARHWAYAGVAVFLVLPAVFGPARQGSARRFLSSPPMQFLGRISYGIFLWQVLVIGRWVSTPLVRPPPPARHPGGQFHLSIWPTLAWTLAVTLVLATLTWVLVERPTLRYKERRMSRFGAGMWVIGLGAFVLRIWSLGTVNARNPDGGDPFFYHAQANMLASGLGFGEPFTWTQVHRLVPSAIHPPLFTLWLAPASLLGARGFLSHKTMAVFAGVGVVVVAGLLARRVAGTRAGLLAAALVAVYPDLWVIDGILWPEGLFTLVVGLTLVAAYRWIDRPTRTGAAVVGAAVGLAALARGEALMLLPLLVLPMVWAQRGAPRGEQLRRFALAGGAALLVLLPWTVRNLLTFDKPVLLSTNSEEVIYYANCPDVYSGPLIGSWSFNCQVRARARGEEPAGDQATKAKVWRARGVAYALAHKDRWLPVGAARISRVWDLTYGESNVTLMRFEGRPARWNRIGLWAYRLMLLPAFAGAVLLRRRRVRVWPLLITGVMVTLTALYAYGSVRFRTPADLAILVLAAVAIDALLPGRRDDGPGSRAYRRGDRGPAPSPSSVAGTSAAPLASDGHASSPPAASPVPEPESDPAHAATAVAAPPRPLPEGS
ncbi:MAG: hypothetical protein JWN46_508 [Acidimicrobiales bacterium]|nr:hypothetical protein [Acidimicrobiales bacterium]